MLLRCPRYMVVAVSAVDSSLLEEFSGGLFIGMVRESGNNHYYRIRL
jgi:hypothetical protein